MKKFLLCTVAFAVLGMDAPASAADLAGRPYSKAPPMMESPIYNWTGFYIGGHVGGAFRGNDNNLLGGSNEGTFMGGGQIGYDTLFAPNWLLGLEANYSFLGTNSSISNRGLGSVTGRLGYTWGPTLLYVKGGYAWADSRFTNASVAAAATMVILSVAVWNTCSPRTGQASSNISITTSGPRTS